MNLAVLALERFFPGKNDRRKIKFEYSGRFKGYNANVKYSQFSIHFSLSKLWEEVDEDIQLGLIHSLYLKLFNEKGSSTELELYHSFMKNVGKYSPVEEQDPILLERFFFLNEEYLSGMIDPPNLMWGNHATTTLGHYEYGTNTITISSVLKEAGVLLDYVLYHEMLHMKFRYEMRGNRALHHSPEFRKWERKFREPDVEKKLNSFLRKKRWKKSFSF